MLFAVSVAKKEVKKRSPGKEFTGLMMFLCPDMVYAFITAEGNKVTVVTVILRLPALAMA